MLRKDFVAKVNEIKESNSAMSESNIKKRIHEHGNFKKDYI